MRVERDRALTGLAELATRQAELEPALEDLRVAKAQVEAAESRIAALSADLDDAQVGREEAIETAEMLQEANSALREQVWCRLV